MKLNIGAGGSLKSPDEDWINVDALSLEGIDLVSDLEFSDLPYDDGSAEFVNMQDFLEHLPKKRQIPFLREVWRVMKPGARTYIQVPDLGVISQRYCGILEEPTPLQHDMTGEQVAASLYGGQEHPFNFHKWGYDTHSLIARLEETGFMIHHIGTDGGQNLLCTAVKPPDKVLIPIGGGIGDMVQVYLAEPPGRKNYEEDNRPPDDEYPTSNVDASLWLKRLRHMKERYPEISIKVVVTSSNLAGQELLAHHPYIDILEVVEPGGKIPSWYNYVDDDGYAYITTSGIGTQWIKFDPDPPIMYMPDRFKELCDAVKRTGNYVVLHPFAGTYLRSVMTPLFTKSLIDRLIDQLGYSVIVVGKSSASDGKDIMQEVFSYKRDGLSSLVNLVDINASVELTLNASAFIGTHSCMILAAWKARIPSVCLVSPIHDGGQPWEEFFADETNPTTWGSRQPFNRTIIVEDKENLQAEIVLEKLSEMGVG